MSESVYVTGEILDERPRAIRFLWDPDCKAEWLPKSQILDRQNNSDGTATLEIPDWLADERGIE